MIQYQIFNTPNAEKQLKEIVDYIAIDLCNPEAADSFLDAIKQKVSELAAFPEMHPLIDRAPWNQMGIRKLVVKSFLLYYCVNKERHRVNILAIVYGRTNPSKQMEQLGIGLPN